MELRSGRRLSSQSLIGSRRRSQPRRCPDGGGDDRISALPDEMLLQILVHLCCARAAAHTSSLSRRWRSLWRHLFELSFRDMPLDAVDAALQQVACPALSRLEIEIPKRHRILDPARVSALLNAAAGLAPADIVIDVCGHCKDRDIPIKIPCFERATSIKLRIDNLYLTPPPGGVEFPALERLSVAGCFRDMVGLIRRCPHLRVLKRFTLRATMDSDFNVLFSAPMVEDLWWSYSCAVQSVGIGELLWRLRSLDLWTDDSAYVLRLNIDFSEYMHVDHDLIQKIALLPPFSVLHILLAAYGHVFGAVVSNLLATYTSIFSLKVVIWNFKRTQACPADCLCDESPNWKSQTIAMTSLEEIEIDGFEGTGHEVDFLKLLFRCATRMKRMTVRISHKLFPSDRGYKEMLSIFEANASVKCYVYRRSGWY